MSRNLILILAIAFSTLAGNAVVEAQAGQPATTPTAKGEAEAEAELSPQAGTVTKEYSGEAGAEGYPFTDQTPDSYWMPARGASDVNGVDWMFNAILGLSIFCFVAITFAVVYLCWRYRSRPGHKAEPSTAHDNILEVTWTIIPSIICVFIFLGGWKGYLNMTTPPSNAMEINVTAVKWSWSFGYPTLEESQPVLHVPVGKPIKLIMRSEDVLHSLYLPAFRLKQDVIPGRYSYVWFEAEKPGVYRVYCAEYCGEQHSTMKTRVVVHETGGYEKWLAAAFAKEQIDCNEEKDPTKKEACFEKQGLRIYKDKGCVQCHSLDGSKGTGPSFQGMWGQTRSFTDGSSGKVDENYVRESILFPQAKVRQSFAPVMPTFDLTDKNIDALNNWMKTL